MEREIKFRAWDGKEMHNDIVPLISGDDLSYIEVQHITKKARLQDVEAIMQYTGLKDKNGKEIYEGDVVEFIERENIGTFNVPDDVIANGGYTGREDKYVGPIVYEYCGFGINDNDLGFIGMYAEGPDTSIEVIGNIYENPELIKEVK